MLRPPGEGVAGTRHVTPPQRVRTLQVVVSRQPATVLVHDGARVRDPSVAVLVRIVKAREPVRVVREDPVASKPVTGTVSQDLKKNET